MRTTNFLGQVRKRCGGDSTRNGWWSFVKLCVFVDGFLEGTLSILGSNHRSCNDGVGVSVHAIKYA